MFTLPQLHLLLCCSWIMLRTLQPQGFCTCSSLYMREKQVQKQEHSTLVFVKMQDLCSNITFLEGLS